MVRKTQNLAHFDELAQILLELTLPAKGGVPDDLIADARRVSVF